MLCLYSLVILVVYPDSAAGDLLLLWPAFLVTCKRRAQIDGGGFGIESFFPESARPGVKHLFDRMCRFWPFPASEGGQGADSAAGLRLPPLATDSVAERRRARALKALDRKLAEMEAEPDVPLEEQDVAVAEKA
jgi:hypothetical protein